MEKAMHKELYHYGVKGMKWGVRRYQNEDGTLTAKGRKKYKNVEGFKRQYNYDKWTKRFLIVAGVSAAVVAGSYAYKLGKLRADRIIKAGTLVQNIGEANKNFNVSFYGVHNKRDQRFFLKNFSDKSWRNHATILKSDKDIKVAGTKQMNKAYKELKKQYPDHYTGRAVDFYRSFGRLSEAERNVFIEKLRKKGYNAFKDVNDVLIDWGDTPTVFFGKDSGLKVRNSVPINIEKAKKLTNIRSKRHIGKNVASAMSISGLYGAIVSSLLKDHQNSVYNRNRLANKIYGKPYKELTYKQKVKVEYSV